jgi:TolB protein
MASGGSARRRLRQPDSSGAAPGPRRIDDRAIVAPPLAELVEPDEEPDAHALIEHTGGREAATAGVQGRLARFAAVDEALEPGRVIATLPPGPGVLTPLDRLRYMLTGHLREAARRPGVERQQAAVVGLLTGLTVGLGAGVLGVAWQERDLLVGLTLTLIVTVSSLFMWWRARSALTAGAHLGALLLMLWLLTPASRIIYESDRDTGFRPQLYVTTANGGSTDRLSSSPTLEADASLAPNGRQIILSHFQDGNSDLYVTEADGANPRNLTRHPAEDRAPAWSPDGAEVAYQSNRSGNWDIYVMQIDGAGLRKVTSSPADDQAPTWSPDGRTLAFQSDRDGFDHIYVLGLRGAVVQLTRGLHEDVRPAWSPDGGLIAFQSNRDGRWQLYVMRPDGSGQRRVQASPGNDMTPAWSPNGQSLVFTSDRDGNLELYTVHVDGGGLRRLTDTPTNERRPAWRAASPINWLAARRALGGWLGLLIPSLRQDQTVIAVAPPAPRDEPSGSGQPLAPGEDVLPYATPRPAPLPAPGVQLLPTPTPGPRPVPTCAPGSFWC